MKTNHTDCIRGRDGPGHARSKFGWVLMAAALLGLSGAVPCGYAQVTAPVEDDAQVLTRGPIHEAFSGLVSFNPEPGVQVTKPPPENIVEIPPAEMPEGDNVTWIPGYWCWDDERDDFLWVSGIWRSLPPDREWVAGYWLPSGNSYQWTSGYWRDAAETETIYLPAPPATLELGPNVAAPSADYGWSPGNWLWRDNRYAWQPGYWYQGQENWAWTPAHYVWTPGGFVYVNGYWDYPMSRRGVLFAPVYYPDHSYARQGYTYTPQVVIDLTLIIENLFLRPRYHHYYFGDYYSDPYRSRGYYTPYDYQSGHYGYDSIYSYQRWTHRDDRRWEDSYRSSYQQKYDREDARPYRLWSDSEKYRRDNAGNPRNHRMVAENYENYTRRQDSPVRYKKAALEERKTIERRNEELREFRKHRGEAEGKLAREKHAKPGEKPEPIKVKSPRSPVAGKPSKDLRKEQSPPKPQHREQPDPQGKPNGRDKPDKPDADKRKNQANGNDKEKARQQDAERRAKEQSEKNRAEPRKEQRDEKQKAREPDAKRSSPEKPDRVRKPDTKADDDAAAEEAKRKREKGKGSKGR